MSKKNEQNVGQELHMDETMKQNVLDTLRELGGVEPSIKAFALALCIPATRIYAIARRPVAGAVYDPDATNWDAISEYINSKLDTDIPNGDQGIVRYTSMAEVVTKALEHDEWLKQNEHKRGGTATGSNLIDVDGGKMPKRKSSLFEMGGENESYLCFKDDANVYKMVYQTAGYTVIRAVARNAEDGTVNFCREEIRVLSNSTMNTKCVAPSAMAQAIEDRFSGAYAVRNAAPIAEDNQTNDADTTAEQ